MSVDVLDKINAALQAGGNLYPSTHRLYVALKEARDEIKRLLKLGADFATQANNEELRANLLSGEKRALEREVECLRQKVESRDKHIEGMTRTITEMRRSIERLERETRTAAQEAAR